MGTPFNTATHEIIVDNNGEPVPQQYDENANGGLGGFVVYEGKAEVSLSGSIVDFAATPVYYGLHTFGTMKISGTEARRPLRPWRSDASFSIINTNAGTSSNVSFVNATSKITISSETFDCKMLDIGDTITITNTTNNNGSFTIAALAENEITTVESLTNEGPGSATITAAGDIPARGGTNLNNYTFEDTSETPKNRLNWHVYGDVVFGKPKLLFICDRNLVGNCRWTEIRGTHTSDPESPDYIFGKPQTIDGITYTVRSLTGGDRDRDGAGEESTYYNGGLLPNEWDRYVMNGVDQDLGPFFDNAIDPGDNPPLSSGHHDYLDGTQYLSNISRRGKHNQLWHWQAMVTLCQETVFDNASRRCTRGFNSSRYWVRHAASTAYTSFGFRPTMELVL